MKHEYLLLLVTTIFHGAQFMESMFESFFIDYSILRIDVVYNRQHETFVHKDLLLGLENMRSNLVGNQLDNFKEVFLYLKKESVAQPGGWKGGIPHPQRPKNKKFSYLIRNF